MSGRLLPLSQHSPGCFRIRRGQRGYQQVALGIYSDVAADAALASVGICRVWAHFFALVG